MPSLDAKEDASFFVDLDVGEDSPCDVDLNNAGEEDSAFEVLGTGEGPAFVDLDAGDDDPLMPPCRVSSPLKVNNHISFTYEEVPDLGCDPIPFRP